MVVAIGVGFPVTVTVVAVGHVDAPLNREREEVEAEELALETKALARTFTDNFTDDRLKFLSDS